MIPSVETEASRQRLIAHLQLHGWYMTIMGWVYVPDVGWDYQTGKPSPEDPLGQRVTVVPKRQVGAPGCVMSFETNTANPTINWVNSPPEQGGNHWPWPSPPRMRRMAAIAGLQCPEPEYPVLSIRV